MIRKKQGFSLIEIIIAVGMLAFISVYVLQVLVTANRLNAKTEDLDQSVYQTNHLIQLFDAVGSIEAFLRHEYIENSEHNWSSDYDTLTLYYNNDWQLLPDEDDQEPSYHIIMTLEKVIDEREVSADGLYRVSMETVKNGRYLLETVENPEIYQISTTRYVP